LINRLKRLVSLQPVLMGANNSVLFGLLFFGPNGSGWAVSRLGIFAIPGLNGKKI
jgi:hypothetical protein